MDCSLSSSKEVDSQNNTSVNPANRMEEGQGVGSQSPQASSPSSVHVGNGDSANDKAILKPDSGDAFEPAIGDIRKKYDLGHVIGSGTFAQVRTATLKDGSGEVRAVKIYESKSSDDAPGWGNKDIFEKEIRLIQQMNSEYIIQMYEFYEDPHFLYIVMEMCSGGEVYTKLVEQKRFTEETAGFLGKQILKAIEYIHSQHIVHRDINAENFVLTGPSMASPLKLVDFGLSCRFEDGVYMSELTGSPHYLAPELIGQRYTNLVDLWAFGVLMYMLLYGRYPFDACNTKALMIKILENPIPWHANIRLSQMCLSFLRTVLDRYPRKRATASACLQHEWIQAMARFEGNETIGISEELI